MFGEEFDMDGKHYVIRYWRKNKRFYKKMWIDGIADRAIRIDYNEYFDARDLFEYGRIDNY